METRVAKWWGWGWEDVSLPVESRPALWRYIQERLKVDPGTIRPVVPLESVRVPPCLVSPGEVEQLRRIVGEEFGLGRLATEEEVRAIAAPLAMRGPGGWQPPRLAFDFPPGGIAIP